MSTKIKILFAEDVAIDYEFAKVTIQSEGIAFEDVLVDNADIFMEQLQVFKPDLVVSDYEMIDFNGRKALELTKKHDPTLPFIMLTGSTNEEIAVECMRAGADDYLLKDKMKRLPFAIKEVMKRAQDIRQKQAMQNALEDSERNYRLIAENSADVIFMLDLRLNFTYISPSVFKQTGFTPEEAMRQRIEETLTPESRQLVLDTYAFEMELEAAGNADPGRMTTLMLCNYHKDGHIIYTETTLSFIRDEKLKPIGVLGIARDITKRKLAEKRLSDSELRYRKLVTEMNQGLAVHEIILDKNGKPINYLFLDVNPAYEKLTGLKGYELIGKTVLDVLPNTEHYWIDRFGKVALSGQPATFENYAKELDRYYHVLAYQNEPNQFVAIINDVTESRKVEEALRESELKFRMIAENSADVIFMIDLNLNFTYISPVIERINGYTVEEVLKRKVTETLTPESQQLISSMFQEEIQLEMEAKADPQRTRKIQLVEYHKQGHLIHVESSVSFLRDENGQAIGIMGITRDITDIVKAEEALSYASLIIKSSPVVAILWENKNNGRAIYVSENCEKVLGYTAADIMADKPNFKEIIHPDDASRVYEEVAENINSKETESFRHKPYRIFKPDGEVVWVDDLTTIIRNQDGEITHFQGIISDVTDRVLFEQEQLKLTESLNQAQQIAKLGSWESELESSKQIWSDNYFRILGLEVNEIVPTSTYFWKHVHPDDVELVKDIASKSISDNQACDFEYRFMLPDGGYIWLQNSIMPVMENGIVTKLKGVSMDISRQKQAEALLLETSERLKKITAQVPGVVYEYQLWPDGRSAFPYSSPGMWEIYECQPEDLVEDASPVFERIHPDDFDRVSQAILESAENQSPYQQEFRVVLPEQGLRWRLSDARPQLMPDGSTLWYGIITDITARKETEEIVRKNQAQISEIFENTPAGLLSFNNKGVVLDCNDQFVAIIGSSKESLIGLDMTKLPDKAMSQTIKEALKGKKAAYEGLYKSYTANKQTEVYVKFAPVFNQLGEVNGGVGIVEDMTERVATQKAIKESEERYRMVYNDSPIGIINYNSQGILIDCNQRFLDIIGSNREKVFGLDLRNLKNKSVKQCVFDTLDNKTAIYEGTYEPLTGKRTAEVHMRFSPLYDAEGQIAGGVGIVEDVTERKQAEEKLKQSDRIFNHAMDMLCIAGFDGYFKTLNPAWAQVLGYSVEELLRKPWLEFVHPDDKESTENAKSTLVDGKEVYQFQNRYICKDGTVKWLSWNSYPYKEEGVMFGVVRDVTQQKNDEQALKESEQLFSKTFFNSPVALFISRLSDNLIIEVNDSFCRLTGFTRKQLLSTTPSDLKITDKELHQKLYHELLQKERVLNIEFPIFTRKGEQQIVLMSAEMIHLKDEAHVLISMLDITDRKQYESELARLTRAVEQSPVSIVITDLEGKIEYVNPRACQVTGYQSYELIGQNPRLLSSGDKSKFEYEDMYKALARGETWQGEFHNKKKDGSLYWESASISPVFNDKGEMINYVAVKEDITARKAMQQELLQSEERYRDMFESNPLPMWIYELDSLAFVEVNEAAVQKYGYSRDEFVQMTLKDIRPTEEVPKLLENVKTFGDRFQQSNQWIHLTKDGKLLDVEINSHSVLDKDGRNLRLVLANDITDKVESAKAMEKAIEMAEASNKLKTTFLNNISHEVRTPLNGILGVMSLLADPDMDEEEREGLNEIVTISSERLMQTITDYMDISLLTSGNMEKSIKHMPVLPAFEGVCRKYAPAIQAKGLELIMDVPQNAESHFVDTDEEMVMKVLSHLLSNALKFTTVGSIKAGYTLRENDIMFYVQDTGKGIRDEYKGKLFDVFSQEEEGNVRKFEGSGLGLSIIKGIADLLGAEVMVKSAFGNGSAFYLSLPYKHKTAIAGEAKPKLPEEKAQQPKVLIAEDDDSNYQVLELMMRKMTNAITLRASNGQEAVDKFSNETDIDLILMDLKMPVMDGFEATRLIRKMNTSIPIIAITAFAMSGDERRAIEAGCNDYLAKPVTMKVLLNKLAEFGLKNLISSELNDCKVFMNFNSKYIYLEAMPQLIILTNSKMHIIYANRLFVDMIEGDANKVLDEPLANLISLPDSFTLQDLPTSFVSYFKWDKKVEYEFRVSATEAEKEDEPEYLWLVEPVAVSENEKVFFESLFDAVPFGIVLLDKDDKVLECNQAFSRLFLYERNEAVGNMINDLIVPTDLWETGTTLTKAVAQGKPIYSETKRRRRDGTLLDVAIIGKPFTMPDGNQLVFGIYQDIGERIAYREAIHKEKAYFEFLFESIPYGVVLLNVKDDIVDCNSGFCHLFGYEKEEIVGKENINLIFTDKYREEGIGLRSRVSSGDRVYAESQRKHKDGRLIDVAISGRKLNMEDGSLFIFALYKDITDRKQVERALEENRQQLSNLIDNLPGMVYRCRYDEYYTMLYVSESSKRILGYDPEIFMGENAINFEQLIHKPYREAIRKMWDKVLTEKTSFEYEYEMDTASGNSIWVWERGRGVFDAAGQLLFLEGYIEDITEHKLAEQQLQNERDLMQALMDNIPDTIYFKDLEGRFIRVNYSQARALGVKHPDDAIGKTDFDFFDHKHAQKSFEDEQQIFEMGDGLINEQEHINTANGWRWFSASKVPLYDAHGKITGLAGVSRDLTTFKNMEQALRNSEQELLMSNKEKDKLFSVIAHDLRSPFNSFLLLTEMFNDESFGLSVEEIRELTVNMHNSVLSLYDLLDNLLSWSAVQRNKVVVDKSSIGLDSFVNDILSYFRSSISKKKLQVGLEVSDDMTIFTDKTMLGSILRNLLSNAIKFTPTGGEILIAAEVGKDGTASISVRDSGIGIPEEMKNNLFTIEAKGRKGTDGEPSSGLGLILVRDFVNLIGGSIEVESQEGIGSTFIVSVPPETND